MYGSRRLSERATPHGHMSAALGGAAALCLLARWSPPPSPLSLRRLPRLLHEFGSPASAARRYQGPGLRMISADVRQVTSAVHCLGIAALGSFAQTIEVTRASHHCHRRSRSNFCRRVPKADLQGANSNRT